METNRKVMSVGKQNITKNKWQLFFAAILAAIILSFGSFYYYLYEKDSMQRDKADDLKSISVLKINEITRWYSERLSEAEYFPANENFVLHTQKLLTESNNASAIEYFTKRLWPIKKRHGYENIFITSADNKILFSLNKDFNKIDSLTSNYIAETLNQKKIIFKDFYYCITHNSIHSDLISPIFDKNKNPIAVFVLRINPNDYLYPLIQNWPLPSKTAETLIFRKDEDSIVFLNSLRHTNHKPLSIKIPLTRKDMISVQGVLGKTGIIEGYDYRNTKVLGNVSPIPVLDCFMVTKIDESEVYGDLRSKATLIIFLSITSILLITSIIMLSYKNRQSKLYNEMVIKEKKLSETQEEFRTTLYSIGDGVITTDINGNVIRMNPVAETLTGWSESEAKDRRLNDIFKIISEKSGEVIENPADIVLRDNIITELKNHTILISKNGKRTPIADTGSPIKNDEGKTIGVVLVFKDETEARLKKRKLLESEQKFSAIFHYSPVGIIITKTDGEIIDVNDIFLNTSGFTRSEVIGSTTSNLKLWKNAADRDQFFQVLFQNHKVPRMEFEFCMKSGEIKTCFISSELIQLNEEKYILSTLLDVSDRVKAEENIRKLSRGIEQSPVTIVITDVNGNIEYANPKFTEITGYSFEEVKGKNSRILKSGNYSQEEYKKLWKTILDKKEWHGHFLNKKKTGEQFWESAVISPILNKKGDITNFIAVKEDITEMKKITDELIKAKEKAEEMNRVKSYFYANISHELRTPFVGIMGFAELLKDKLADPEEKEMAEVILNSSRRLTETLNKILDITKLEFDKAEVNLTNVNICELIEQLQILYSQSAKQQNTIIKTEFKCNSILLKTDETLLQEVLSNLINNAVKFTTNGVIEIQTEICKKNKKDYLLIKVSDTGIGIPKEKQDLIWLEFRQASEGLSRTFEGTGLGLSIAKKYVNLLDGNIYVDSEPGKGSVFTIELPIIKSLDITASNESDTQITSDIKKTKHKLLYVEDDIITKDFVKRLLSGKYFLDEASSAETALELIKVNQYQALLLDINLGPEMDGVELTKKIREFPHYKSIPMIAVTAYASANDREEFLSKGFSHYISKPFASGDLLCLLENVFAAK